MELPNLQEPEKSKKSASGSKKWVKRTFSNGNRKKMLNPFLEDCKI